MAQKGSADDGTKAADVAQFDLGREMAECEEKRPWQMGHFAKTLVKKPDFRMVLISMDEASQLKEHHADGTISLQVLKGTVRFTAAGKTHELSANGVLTLGASIPHQVKALKKSALLLTIAWPEAKKLEAMEHRGYGT
jgi:quercetin dioxygenase-like cupin family protein